MIRSVINKCIVFSPRLVWKRWTHSDAWYQRYRTEKDDKQRETRRDLWHRRVLAGPDDPQPRSEVFLWDYEAELFAFGKRLGENFTTDSLRRAFRHSSYTPVEISDDVEHHAQIETDEDPVLHNNQELIRLGAGVINVYVPAYLRYHFAKLPEEGIHSVSAYLCSEQQLAYLAKNLGMGDLVLSKEFPLADSTLSGTFKAVVGALAVDSGETCAEYFVQDFVLTELIDLDVNEIFYTKNPMAILSSVLAKRGKGPPEYRILRQNGSFTSTPVYLVGVYVDGQLIGQSPGETIEIGEEMAARDSLKTLWGTRREQRSPVNLGPAHGRRLKLESYKNGPNESLKEMLEEETELVENAVGEEPLVVEELYRNYKENIEPTLGKVYRRRFKHYFYHGSLMRRCHRSFVRPNVKTI